MRYRAAANISIEFESDDTHIAASNNFKNIIDKLFESSKIGDYNSYSSQVNLLNVPTKRHPKRIGEFTIEEVLPYITEYESYKTYTVNGQKYEVRMNIDKYFVFLEHIHCAACNLEGTKMMLELSTEDIPHFNLYGVDNGKLVLMNRDHVLARANGGRNHKNNYITTCLLCNNLKADADITYSQLSGLRQIYNKHKGKMPQKEFTAMIKETRSKMEKENKL